MDSKFGCPPRFIAMVWQFHDSMQARVQSDGEFSEPFEVTNGVKQGCVIAPTLFIMMFSAMLMDAFQDSYTGFPIRYRFDGNIFNLRRLHVKTKVQTDVLDELSSMQMIWMPAQRQKCKEPWIKFHRHVITMISQSAQKHRGCTPTSTWKALFPEQCTLMMRSLPELQKQVWLFQDYVQMSGSAMESSLKVYKAVILPTLLCACETWTVYQRHEKRLNHIHLSGLRKLLKIKWQDKMTDTEVLKKAAMQCMHTVLKLAQLWWTGHKL